MKHTRKLRLLSVALLLALALACVPASASAESGFYAYVSTAQMAVYRDTSLTQYWGSLPQNTVVWVNGYVGEVAQITYRDRTGYAFIYDMKQATSAPTVESVESVTVQSVTKAAISTQQTRVYKKPSLKSKYVTVPAGLTVNVQDVKGSCAQVERNGCIGYMYTGHLTTYEAVQQAVPQGEPIVQKQETSGGITTLEQAAASGQFSNEQLLYAFATKVMGYNSAAACGLLGNCYFESNFSTASLSDGGTSYGLFQWHASRWTRLKNFCEKYGYDPNSVVGQLYFLQYELKEYYPKVDNYLRAVSNNAQGAYEAGYYVCTVYLVPANKESQGEKRGNRAKTTYWEKYNGTAV